MYERTGTLIQKKFGEYLLPTIMTSLAMSLASVIDSAIVGNLLGSESLAAIGLSSPLIFCINTIYILFGVGGMSCASIAKGQVEKKRANQLFTTAMAGGLIVMFAFVLITNIFMEPITLSLAGGNLELAALTTQYLRPLLFTGPALMFSSGLALFVRTDGSPKSSAMIVVIANVVNLVCDYTLIKYLDSGIAGAGLSTTIGYIAGGFVVIPYLMSKNRSFRFDIPKPSEMGVLLDIIKTGMPKALTQITSLGRSIVLNGIVVAILGSVGMSVMTVCINVLMIANIFVGGTSDALLPIVGTLFGEKDYFGIYKAIGKAKIVLIIACIGLVTFFMVRPQAIGVLFGMTSTEELAILIPALRMFALYLPFQAFNTTLQNIYNITDRKSMASTIATLDGFVYVCIFAFLLSRINGNVFWLCYALSGCATMISVLMLGKQIRKKEPVVGIFLLKEDANQDVVWDMSIYATQENAVSLSADVIEFCMKNNIDKSTSNKIGIAIEEMVINITKYCKKDKKKKEENTVDILLRITGEEIIVRFRDNGETFDATSYIHEHEVDDATIGDGILLMNQIASKVEYIKQLGFNSTIFTLDLQK